MSSASGSSRSWMTSELRITTGAAYTVWKLTYRSRTLTSETGNPIGGMMVSAPYRTRLDRAAWRPMHNRILLALGIGWALDSFEVQIIGSVLTPLANDFGVLGTDGAIAPCAVSLIWVVWFARADERAIPESPRWLASQGRHADADAIITAISGLVQKRPAWRQAWQRQAGRGGTSRSAQVRSGSATSR